MNTTAWWILALIAVAVGYDIFAYFYWAYEGTISFKVLTASRKYPIIPFAVGVIAGHLFWPQ